MKNIITKIVSNNVSQIVKKKPNKSELRSYLNHMLFFDNLGNDSYGFNMNCEIFKVYNFICSEFIPEFYSTDHVDTFLDPYSASKYHQVMSIVEKFSDDEIEYVLKQNHVYPEFIFGIKTFEGIDNYFNSYYTDVKYYDPINKIVVFQCFMSELSELCNEQKSISYYCREIIIHSEDTFLLRELDHAVYCIYKHFNNEFEYITCIEELHEMNDQNTLIKINQVLSKDFIPQYA